MRALVSAFGYLLALVLAVGGAAQAFLPGALARALEDSIRQRVAAAGPVQVEVGAVPALKLLAGRADRLRVEARQLVLGPAGAVGPGSPDGSEDSGGEETGDGRAGGSGEGPAGAGQAEPEEGPEVETVTLDAEGVQLDLVELARTGRVRILSAQRLEAAVTLEEGALNRYFWNQVHLQPSLRQEAQRLIHLELGPGQARLVGRAEILGTALEVEMGGRFRVEPGDVVVFEPQVLSVQQARLPSVLVQALADRFRFQLDLTGLPIPIALREIRVEDGRLQVLGGLREALGP